MKRVPSLAAIAGLVVGLAGLAGPISPASAAQPADAAPAIDAGLLSGLQFRSVGPALMSGRISDLAIDPVKPNTWYIAVGSGGVWKTVNAGTTWDPIFDDYGSYSIGCVTLDPNDRHTLWVGTGENVGGRHVGFGDGVYLSRDGGKSFTNMGLKDSGHLSRIIVHPHDSDVIYVASQGPLWSGGGERGLYKSIDGGQSWEQILAKGEWTGVTDIAMDPNDPDVMFAATHQRHRTVAALMNTGAESGIHKSTDGGETWTELRTGLPSADKGKIALAISPQDSDVVYATIELAGRTGGFFRSSDGGESWTKQSDYLSGGTGPHYYQEIYADPHRFDVVYHANVRLGRTSDGGATFENVSRPSKHVDNHAVAFHPNDPDFLLVGCDGGIYTSRDQGATYAYAANLPLTQFYKVDVDYDWPVYNIVGGTQDNNTQYGPSRTLSRNGIRNADWRITIGGDGHDCAIDPEDPNIIYCESQQGFLRRFDRKTGESVDIRPQPEQGEESLRFNWDSPIHISPHSHTRLYFGSKKLHRSDDRGDSWTTVSGDLSRGQDRFLMPMMGRVHSIDAGWDLLAMSRFGNITSVSESPLVEGLIYVGTDDGLIQVTEDGGENWRSTDKIFGVPEYFFVNDIKADRHDADTVYACVDDHKNGDFAPYIIKSTDRGRTWTSISGDLPERHLAWRIIQDHEEPNLLFAGTEYGAFATLDGGEHWIKLAGIPTIPVRDLEIQRRENDLVAATFGRSFYVLDDYSPLRELSESLVAEHDFHIFPVKDALLYMPEDLLGGRTGSQGDGYYSAENPAFGAQFTIHMKDSLTTQKQQRAKREASNRKAGADNPYPGWDAIKEEDREDTPAVMLEIRDASGNTVDRLDAPTGAGMHRVNWNLRYAPFSAGQGGRGGSGPMVAPGTYTVTAYRRAGDETVQMGETTSFEVVSIIDPALPMQDRESVLEFQFAVGQLQQSATAASASLAEAIEEVTAIKQLITSGRTLGLPLLDEARRVELKLRDAQELITGDRTATSRFAEGVPSITSRIQNAMFGSMRQSYGPTKTHRRQYEIARDELEAALVVIDTILTVDMPALKQKLDEAGAPWTPGRPIPNLP